MDRTLSQSYAAVRGGTAVMEKHFLSAACWKRETELRERVSKAVFLPETVYSEPGLLVTRYVACPTLLSELEWQEKQSFCEAPWSALLNWLQGCLEACGQLPEDGDLRNFLWDSQRNRIIAANLESFTECASVQDCIARILAWTAQYLPAQSRIGCEISSWFESKTGVSAESVSAAEAELSLRKEADAPFSGAVLSGGASRRMGRSKAELQLLGKSFIQRQTDKLRLLGAAEILLSGSGCPNIAGTRTIPDVYPGRGPLGGIHACLNAAQYDKCVVLSVDTPLVPVKALRRLYGSCGDGVTVLRHGGKPEPLVGVYCKATSGAIESLIHKAGAPVRTLQRLVEWKFWDYLGPEELLQNCNTPQELERVRHIAEQYAALSLPI